MERRRSQGTPVERSTGPVRLRANASSADSPSEDCELAGWCYANQPDFGGFASRAPRTSYGGRRTSPFERPRIRPTVPRHSIGARRPLRGLPVTIELIVEGHGEVEAVPVLLRRLRDEGRASSLEFGRPIRRKRPELTQEGAVRKAVRLALLRSECRGILILFDADDDCPAEVAPASAGVGTGGSGIYPGCGRDAVPRVRGLVPRRDRVPSGNPRRSGKSCVPSGTRVAARRERSAGRAHGRRTKLRRDH